MNKIWALLFFCILSQSTLWTAEIECLVCFTQDNIFSLCPKESDHTLTCKTCCPPLFDRGTCSYCQGPLKEHNLLPLPFQEEITVMAENVALLNIEKRIDQERLVPMKGHHASLVKVIVPVLGYYVNDKDNQKIARNTIQTIMSTEDRYKAWTTVINAFMYHRAWNELIRDTDKVCTGIKIKEILDEASSYSDQENIHRVAINPERLHFLHLATLEALQYTEGHPQDCPPNLKEVAEKNFIIAETSF